MEFRNGLDQTWISSVSLHDAMRLKRISRRNTTRYILLRFTEGTSITLRLTETACAAMNDIISCSVKIKDGTLRRKRTEKKPIGHKPNPTFPLADMNFRLHGDKRRGACRQEK